MIDLSVLPMTGAAAIGPIPAMLFDRAGDRAVEHAFARADLSIAALDTPRAPIPLQGLTRLWESGARATGDRCFGFSGGFEMTHATYGLWLEYCVSAPSLGAALARIPRSLHFHQTGTRFTFTLEGNWGVLRYHPAWPGQFKQHSDHVVGSAVRLVQGFLGPEWRPGWVELDYERDPGWRQLETSLQAPLRFGAATTGIAVGRRLLSRRRMAGSPRALTLADVSTEASVATAPEPLRSIYNVAAYRLLEGAVDLEGAAAFCGIGVQTLQRRLRKEGLTYREVLAAARRRRAKALLRETRMPVAEIAYALGYEEHANFTHAFKRWTGCSPSGFRAGRH